MNGNPLLYNISELAKDYYRFFEVGTGFFLRDGAQSAFVNNYDYKKYSKYFGARNDITSSGTHEGLESQGKVSSFPKETCIKQSFHQKQTIIFFSAENQYGNSLLFMAIAVNTSLQFANLGYRDGLPVHDNWENFIETQVCPVSTLRNWSAQQHSIRGQCSKIQYVAFPTKGLCSKCRICLYRLGSE